jgi:hypothetical protein
MHYELGEADNHVKWCFSRLRFMSSIVKDKLKKDSIWEDFLQELYATGYIAWQQKMDMAETRRYASRQIHAFFKEYGYKAYRNTYIKMDQSFSAVFADWQVNNLGSPEVPVVKDTAGDRYLQEHIVNILKRKPTGMTRADLSTFLEVPVKELQWHLDTLLKERRIIQVKRESYEGSPPTPLFFITGAVVPEQRMVKTEMYENIRRLYFSEGKTMDEIASSCHHSLHTICKAIHSVPHPAANCEKRELATV